MVENNVNGLAVVLARNMERCTWTFSRINTGVVHVTMQARMHRKGNTREQHHHMRQAHGTGHCSSLARESPMDVVAPPARCRTCSLTPATSSRLRRDFATSAAKQRLKRLGAVMACARPCRASAWSALKQPRRVEISAVRVPRRSLSFASNCERQDVVQASLCCGGLARRVARLPVPRCFHESSAVRSAAALSDADLGESIRILMRSSAQPVAVITTLIDGGTDPEAQKQEGGPQVHAHGATLSSFTTVSMDPPLVAFSLRTPSRLADCLVTGAQRARQDEQGGGNVGSKMPTVSSLDLLSAFSTRAPTRPHFVINVLTKGQSSAADGFARPGSKAYPLPSPWGREKLADGPRRAESSSAVSSSSGKPHPFDTVGIHPSSHAFDYSGGQAVGGSQTLSPVPVLSASIGSLACSLVGRLDLGQFAPGKAADEPGKEDRMQEEHKDPEAITTGSDLYLARVHALDQATEAPSGPEDALPLLYWERAFTTVKR